MCTHFSVPVHCFNKASPNAVFIFSLNGISFNYIDFFFYFLIKAKTWGWGWGCLIAEPCTVLPSTHSYACSEGSSGSWMDLLALVFSFIWLHTMNSSSWTHLPSSAVLMLGLLKDPPHHGAV